jgi:drug/metabolite transporter (DMT)-like permease
METLLVPAEPMPPARPSHLRAALLAVLVTLLWSSSWVLIKLGLRAEMPALTFAGLRYCLAFACLLPFVLARPAHRAALHNLPRGQWWQLAALGVVYYGVTQGAQFVGLAFLPAAALTLLLNFTPVIIALFSGLVTREPATRLQWLGIVLAAGGGLVYFLPLTDAAYPAVGLLVALVGLLANAGSTLLGRRVNVGSGLAPIVVSTVSMGIGGLLLMASGVWLQGLGQIGPTEWLIVGWLAVVNTAVAFTWWNRSQQTLSAVESGLINNLMLPQIALLAWIFLAEPLSPRQFGGILIVAAGTVVVQLGQLRSRRKSPV